MDASLLSEKQLSALELMMSHADEAHGLTQGAPKRKRKQKTLAEQFPDGFTYEEEYVGTGSRALNREMKNKAARPDNKQVVKALEAAFAEQSVDNEQLIHSVDESTESTKQVAKTLADWLKWTQDRAFKQDHEAKADASIAPPETTTANLPATVPDSSLPDADFGDEGARDRNGRRTRRRGRGRGRRFRGGGRAGKALGLLALLGTGLAAAHYMKDDTDENLRDGKDVHADGESSANNNPVAQNQKTDSEIPVQNNGTQAPETPRVEKAVSDEQKQEAQDKQDAMWDAGTTGAMLLAGSKRVPLLGAAVTAADGVYEANKISKDDTLTEEEKHNAQITNAVSTGGAATGATIGAWAGGALGSIVPGFGTAIGATLGGLLGSYLGDKIGGFVAEKITNETDSAVKDDRKRREEEDRQNSLMNNPVANTYAPPVYMPMALGGAIPNGAGINAWNGGAGPVRFPGQTSKRSQEIADSVLSKDKIGGVSEQFESGGRGVGTVSSGKGDFGGVSYGKHQLASNNGSMAQFLASPEAKGITGDFSGLTPGTAAFNERYKQVAATHGKEMEDAQYKYLVRANYAPAAERLEKNLGIDMSKQSRAVQEMVYSTAMQYGGSGGASKIERALKGKDLSKMSQKEIIEAVQKDKMANVQNDFRSSSGQVQQGVAARALQEMDVLHKIADADEKKKDEQPTEVAKDTTVKKSDDGTMTVRATKTDDGKIVTTVDKPIDPNAAKVDMTDVNKSPAKVPFEQMTVEQKEQELADMQKRVEFLKQKKEYIQQHPEVTRADDKAVNEAVRNQMANAASVVGKDVDQSAVVRSETIASKPERAPDVERAVPLEKMPEPVATEQVADAGQQKGSGNNSSGAGARSVPASSGNSSAAPSLDNIPVILEDPLLNLINVGYV